MDVVTSLISLVALLIAIISLYFTIRVYLDSRFKISVESYADVFTQWILDDHCEVAEYTYHLKWLRITNMSSLPITIFKMSLHNMGKEKEQGFICSAQTNDVKIFSDSYKNIKLPLTLNAQNSFEGYFIFKYPFVAPFKDGEQLVLTLNTSRGDKEFSVSVNYTQRDL